MSLLPFAGGRRAQATTRKSGNLPTRLADSTSRIRGMRKVRRCPGAERTVPGARPRAREPYRLLPCSLAGEQGVFMCAPPASGTVRGAPEKECY